MYPGAHQDQQQQWTPTQQQYAHRQQPSGVAATVVSVVAILLGLALILIGFFQAGALQDTAELSRELGESNTPIILGWIYLVAQYIGAAVLLLAGILLLSKKLVGVWTVVCGSGFLIFAGLAAAIVGAILGDGLEPFPLLVAFFAAAVLLLALLPGVRRYLAFQQNR